jgi:hypothetical protein
VQKVLACIRTDLLDLDRRERSIFVLAPSIEINNVCCHCNEYVFTEGGVPEARWAVGRVRMADRSLLGAFSSQALGTLDDITRSVEEHTMSVRQGLQAVEGTHLALTL